jgi:hypothetical protein
MRTFRCVCVSIVLSVPLSGVIVAQACADDGKTYPASMCHPVTSRVSLTTERKPLYHLDFNGGSNRGSIEWSFDAAGNVSGKRMLDEYQDWFCPVVRDHLVSHSIRTAQVYVIDDHSGDGMDVCCHLHSKKGDGSFVDNMGACTRGFSSNPVRLEISTTKEQSYGFYEIVCSIPPPERWNGVTFYSSILSYRVDENP